mmetsp:Transcript_5430/g.7117  ORF Transcript_5430/g.7117 Transcript_5430/m.7117 type:complete len:94 (-) Transcript_5430:4173-4454(-)
MLHTELILHSNDDTSYIKSITCHPSECNLSLQKIQNASIVKSPRDVCCTDTAIERRLSTIDAFIKFELLLKESFLISLIFRVDECRSMTASPM